MKKYIIKHYWKNGENATWENSSNAKEELLSYLKKNYSHFVERRDEIVYYEKYTIRFEYEDSIDNFNRPITNITFHVQEKFSINKVAILFIAILIGVSIVFFFWENSKGGNISIENQLEENKKSNIIHID